MRTPSIILLACLGTALAHAGERDPLDSQFMVETGWFFMSTDMRVRLDGENTANTGSDVDYDDTFGIGDFDRFRVDGSWRIAPRHLLHAMYFENNRRATRSLQRDVTFRDEIYPIGLTVAASTNLTVAQLSYEYAFLRRETYEFAGGIGVHYLDVELGLDATLDGQGGSTSRTLNEKATTQAPLPVAGLRGLWRLPHDLYIAAQAQYFHIEFDAYEGSLLDIKASVVWQFSDHVGIGVAYNDFGFRFDIEDRRRFNGRLGLDYGGAIAFANFMF